MNLYVGNLSFGIRDDDLRQAFAEFGEVTSARVMMDRDNPNRSRGFGFVEMVDDAAAKAAIEALNGKELDGREIKVNEAQPREERPRGGGSRDGQRGDDRDRNRPRNWRQ